MRFFCQQYIVFFQRKKQLYIVGSQRELENNISLNGEFFWLINIGDDDETCKLRVTGNFNLTSENWSLSICQLVCKLCASQQSNYKLFICVLNNINVTMAYSYTLLQFCLLANNIAILWYSISPSVLLTASYNYYSFILFSMHQTLKS